MKIKVTQEHLRQGSCNDGQHCPVALALKDVGLTPFVGVNGLYINPKYSIIKDPEIPLPEEVTQFIKAYDEEGQTNPDIAWREGFVPFEFELPTTP